MKYKLKMTSTSNQMTKAINNNLIGMCGRKRSGKDTAGDYLIEKYNYVQYSFAGPLKRACKEIFMFSDQQTEGNDKEMFDDRWNITARKVFQIFGTEMFRQKLGDFFPEMEHIKENFWIYRFQLWYAEQKQKNPNVKVVVTDVRFPNEAKIVQKLGGRVIKVNRDTGMLLDNHSSEKNIDLIQGDITLENNGTLEEYYIKVDKALGHDISQADLLRKKICSVINKIEICLNNSGEQSQGRFCLYYNTVLTHHFGYEVAEYPGSLITMKKNIQSIKNIDTLETILLQLKCFQGIIC